MSEFDAKQFDRLVSELCDQTIDGDALEQLERLVAEDPAALDRYTEFMTMHVHLEIRQLRGASLVDVPACALPAPERETITDAPSAEPARSRERASRSRALGQPARRLLAVTLAVGACLALMLGLPQSVEPEPRRIGVLTAAEGAVWSAAGPRDTPSPVIAGQRLQLSDGIAEISLSSGVVVVMRGPAAVELVSPMRVRADHGVVRARVGEDARGFVIATPTTEVVDLGTEFGVDVSEDSGETDVVVFDGAVDLQYVGLTGRAERSPRRGGDRAANGREELKRLKSGEALHVDRRGDFHRIVSIRSEDFPDHAGRNFLVGTRQQVIRGISDNIRDADTSAYYQIVSGGLREDARAYVDRYHEWNGIDEEGIPAELAGADYVMTFNTDKWQSNIEITVELACPAKLFVFFDERLPAPEWLVERFTNTGLRIGVDEGFKRPNYRVETLLGPGKSIDTRYSVWRLDVPQPGSVALGALPKQELSASMYGIAAMPLPTGSAAGTNYALGDGSKTQHQATEHRLLAPSLWDRPKKGVARVVVPSSLTLL